MSTSDPLRELYQEARSRPADGDECLPVEILERLATAQLSVTERTWAVDHLSICSDCVQEYRLARDLADSAELIPRPEATAASRRRLAWAATLVLAFGAGYFLSRDSSWRDWSWRAEGESATRGASNTETLVVPAPDSVLQEAPTSFSWAKGPEGSVSEVVLYDREGSLVWRSESTTNNVLSLPDEVTKQMVSGTYHWQVLTRHGVERAASHLSSFRIDSNPKGSETTAPATR